METGSDLYYFIGGDCDFDEITEEEAEAIVKKRKAGALNA